MPLHLQHIESGGPQCIKGFSNRSAAFVAVDRVIDCERGYYTLCLLEKAAGDLRRDAQTQQKTLI